MQIFPVTPRGYCKGVVHAINIAKQTRLRYPDHPITMLGMIVHNRYVIDAFQKLNLHYVDDARKTRLQLLDEIESGVVIFTAHGVSDEVRAKAEKKGLIVVDASCQDVIKTQNIVKSKIAEHYHVAYIGKKNHPEAEAVLAISDKVTLITSHDDIQQLDPSQKWFVTNQTTMSHLDTQSLIQQIQEQVSDCTVSEEICNATMMRQKAILELENTDCLIVVGDPHSNNSKMLKKMGETHGINPVIMVESIHELDLESLRSFDKIAVTSGASTPTVLTNQVIETLQTLAATGEIKIAEAKEIL